MLSVADDAVIRHFLFQPWFRSQVSKGLRRRFKTPLKVKMSLRNRLDACISSILGSEQLSTTTAFYISTIFSRFVLCENLHTAHQTQEMLPYRTHQTQGGCYRTTKQTAHTLLLRIMPAHVNPSRLLITSFAFPVVSRSGAKEWAL